MNVMTVNPNDVICRLMCVPVPVVDSNNRVIGIVAQADVATRVEMPNKTAEVVEQISQPSPV